MLDHKKNKRKPTNSEKMNDYLLTDYCVKVEIRREIKASLEYNESKFKTYPDIGNTVKVVLRGSSED